MAGNVSRVPRESRYLAPARCEACAATLTGNSLRTEAWTICAACAQRLSGRSWDDLATLAAGPGSLWRVWTADDEAQAIQRGLASIGGPGEGQDMDGHGYWACTVTGACVRGAAQPIYRPHQCGGCPWARQVTGDGTGLAKSRAGEPLTRAQQERLRQLKK